MIVLGREHFIQAMLCKYFGVTRCSLLFHLPFCVFLFTSIPGGFSRAMVHNITLELKFRQKREINNNLISVS